VKRAIFIPWRGGNTTREEAFAETWRRLWKPLGIAVYTGDSEETPFNRGASRNAAAAGRAWDVALFADADVLLSPKNIHAALDAAYLEDVVVFPHDRYHALSRSGRVQRASTAPTNGGALAISRTAWGLVQGFDARFKGWGWEDFAFKMATETILGDPIRIPGPMSELFHQKTGRGRPDTDRALGQRYRRAVGDREAMLAIVNEDPLG
jgi:hypothetical protein